MTYYITVDGNNQIENVYAEGTEPTFSVPITDQQFDTITTHPKGHPAFKYINGDIVCVDDIPEYVLSEFVRDARAEIDVMSGKIRSLHTTIQAGQTETYLTKYFEAVDFIERDLKDTTKHPHIQAEVDYWNEIGVSKTPQQAAEYIIQIKEEWSLMSAKIEFIRLSSKQKLNKATSIEEAQMILVNAGKELSALK